MGVHELGRIVRGVKRWAEAERGNKRERGEKEKRKRRRRGRRKRHNEDDSIPSGGSSITSRAHPISRPSPLTPPRRPSFATAFPNSFVCPIVPPLHAGYRTQSLNTTHKYQSFSHCRLCCCPPFLPHRWGNPFLSSHRPGPRRNPARAATALITLYLVILTRHPPPNRLVGKHAAPMHICQGVLPTTAHHIDMLSSYERQRQPGSSYRRMTPSESIPSCLVF